VRRCSASWSKPWLKPPQSSNDGLPIKLSLGDYRVNDGSIGCNRDETRFAFTLWPLPALVSALEGVAQRRLAVGEERIHD